VEAVGVALVVFGPFVAIMVLLVIATRKAMPARRSLPPWQAPRPGHASGDREPRRPLIPSRSGAASLPLPVDDGNEPHDDPVRRIEPPPSGAPGRRLAG
jgi:hypothetical protein